MSIAALKRKTMNGNPRLAPISGSGNGPIFSLNGTRRNIGRIGEHLAPGAMVGPSSLNGGIHGHDSHCCTNDLNVVKPSVMNTAGMLSRRLNCLTGAKAACNNCTSAEDGNPPGGCYNWVKKPLYNGDQGEYIERVVRVSGQPHTIGHVCNETKYGPNGLLDPSLNNCHESLCLCVHKPSEAGGTAGIWACKRKNLLNMAKPGIRTVDYSMYINTGLMKKNCLPQAGHNLKPWLLNSTHGSGCRGADYTCICGHQAINDGCPELAPPSGASVWISYSATGEPYVNVQYGSTFGLDISNANSSLDFSTIYLTPSFTFGGPLRSSPVRYQPWSPPPPSEQFNDWGSMAVASF